MKKLIAIPFIALLAVLASCSTKPSYSPSLEAYADSLIRPLIDSGKIAGASVAVVKGENILLRKTYGFGDLEFNVPMPEDATFEIGSVTKQFTCVAILQLAAEGKLSLDDEPSKYIRFDSRGRRMTIRNLMNHTSGIKGYTEMPVFEVISMQAHPLDTLIRMVEKEPYDFEPGDRLIYNNTGFFMLGLIIEKVSGLSYEEYVQKNLFDKAGMTNSYYGSENKIISHRAHGYDWQPDGLVRTAYLNHLWPYAAGSLCSNPDDLIKWNEALHNGKVLDESSYEELLATAVLNDGTVTRYGKGITVTEVHGETMLEHGGGINGFLSENRYFPKSDVHVVVLFNTAGPHGPGPIADQLVEKVLGKTQVTESDFPGDLAELTGTYGGRARGRDVTVEVFSKDKILFYVFNKDTSRLIWSQNGPWSHQGQQFYFKPSELHVDQVYAFYKFQKLK